MGLCEKELMCVPQDVHAGVHVVIHTDYEVQLQVKNQASFLSSCLSPLPPGLYLARQPCSQLRQQIID